MNTNKFITWGKFDRWFNRSLKISGTFGSFIALFYFLKIKSTPIDSVESLAGLAAAVALVSIMLFVGLLLYWGLPGILFQLWVESDDDSISTWFFVEFNHGSEQAPRASGVKIFLWCLAMVACPWILFISFADASLLGGVDTIRYLQIPVVIYTLIIVAIYVMRCPRQAKNTSSNAVSINKIRWYGAVKRFALCSVFLITNAWPLFVFFQSISISEAIKQSAEHVVAIFSDNDP